MINSVIEQHGGIEDGNTDVLWNSLNLGHLLQQEPAAPPTAVKV